MRKTQNANKHRIDGLEREIINCHIEIHSLESAVEGAFATKEIVALTKKIQEENNRLKQLVKRLNNVRLQQADNNS